MSAVGVGVNKKVYVNQLAAMVEKLAKTPYSRRVQVVTWQLWVDLYVSAPPCLRHIWTRILPDDEGVWRLNMNVSFRSRDSFKAAYMNCFAFAELQRHLAKQIAELAGREVKLGRYCDFSDSYHIYGYDLNEFVGGFLKLVQERTFEERTWTREFAQPFFDEAKPKILEKVRNYDERRQDSRGDGML